MILLPLLAVLLGATSAPRPLDDFEDLSRWKAVPSDGIEARISGDDGVRGRSLRLDYDFQNRGGYAVIRRDLPLDLPENYEITFQLRGEGLPNNLEFKLIDPTGDNVWWVNRRDFAPPREWTEIRIKKRHIQFAWGPLGGGELKRVAALEIAVTAGRGGKGFVQIDDLALTPLPPDRPYDRTPKVSTGDGWYALDFLQRREYGGLIGDWEPGRHATRYEVQVSDDGQTWKTLRTVEDGNGGRDYHYLPETDSRHLRLRFLDGPGAFEIANLAVQPLEFAASRNAFLEAIAKDAPRGRYPRATTGEQVYWTVVGVDADSAEAMLSEDGQLETGKARFSIEPFLFLDGKLLTWADVKSTQTLAENELPIPSVTWAASPVSLEITALAAGEPGSSVLHARYRLRNNGASEARPRLFLAVRPFQVNPPYQFLNTPGGEAPIREIVWDGRAVTVDGRTVVPAQPPTAFGATIFDAGDVTESLARGELPKRQRVADSFGHASAALAWDFRLAPGETRDVEVAIPLHSASDRSTTTAGSRVPPPRAGGGWTWGEVRRGGGSIHEEGSVARLIEPTPLLASPHAHPASRPGGRDPRSSQPRESVSAVAFAVLQPFEEVLAAEHARWREKLNRVEIRLPAAAADRVHTLRSNLAYILINRDGPGIQPGSRSYERSWIRDGALTSTALLRLGHADAARDFLIWFAGHQFPNGKVPCCVDHRGADPVPEHDSHGEFLHLAAEVHRFTGDRDLLARLWPNVQGAVTYMDELRRQRRTDEYRRPEKLAYFGLLPESISHEGYSDRPVHSYWDDFWGLGGLKDAVTIAQALGKTEEATRWAAIRDEFQADLHASIRRAIALHQLDTLPASVEKGDFDPSSTSIGLAPAGELARLPRAELLATFERYWQESIARRDGRREWNDYTPYELRNLRTFLRLGWLDRTHELLDFFFADRRPAGWNHWAEVVARDIRKGRFLGDMPHTWVGSEYLHAFLDLLAYIREDDQALILGAGIPPEWVTDREGVTVRNLRTEYGPLSYTVTREGEGVRFRVEKGFKIPPGGVIVSWQGREQAVRQLPADVVTGR